MCNLKANYSFEQLSELKIVLSQGLYTHNSDTVYNRNTITLKKKNWKRWEHLSVAKWVGNRMILLSNVKILQILCGQQPHRLLAFNSLPQLWTTAKFIDVK